MQNFAATVTRYYRMNIAGDESRAWVLVDHLNKEQSGLLGIGDVNYHGVSVRKNLSPLGRELLMERIRAVAETSEAIDETITRRGLDFRVLVEPILAPASGILVAVHAVYFPATEEIPERPVVGALEWDIWDDGRVDTRWDDNMFRLYEIPRTGASSPTGDMNAWVAQLIAPEDRARMKLTIDAGIKDSNGKRYFVNYRIITRMGTDNTGVKNLEVSSCCNPDPVLPVRRLRAISREVPQLTPAINPEFGDTGGLVKAIFELATDIVLVAVDTRRWQTFMTSPSWDKYELQAPQYGYLPHVVHPDDFAIFRERLQTDGLDKVRVRFLHRGGEYRPYSVQASAGLDTAADADYVICRLKAIS
jgi:hypothetical protein